MTPYNIFLDCIAIVMGISIPFLLVRLSLSFINFMHDYYEKENYAHQYHRFMNPKYWHFKRITQCPNPKMVSFEFSNGESGEEISISLDKSVIKELNL